MPPRSNHPVHTCSRVLVCSVVCRMLASVCEGPRERAFSATHAERGGAGAWRDAWARPNCTCLLQLGVEAPQLVLQPRHGLDRSIDLEPANPRLACQEVDVRKDARVSVSCYEWAASSSAVTEASRPALIAATGARCAAPANTRHPGAVPVALHRFAERCVHACTGPRTWRRWVGGCEVVPIAAEKNTAQQRRPPRRGTWPKQQATAAMRARGHRALRMVNGRHRRAHAKW